MFAGYIRVSDMADRDEDDESFISVDVQRDKILAWGRANDCEVEVLPPELNVSGGSQTRPGYLRILAGIEDGTYEGVVVMKLDRWSRHAPSAIASIDAIHQVGGKFVATDEPMFNDTSPTGRAMGGVLAILAQLQKDNLAAGWDDATRRAVDAGVHIPSAPFGYRRVVRVGADGLETTKRSPLVPDEVTGPLVPLIFQWRAEGKSWAAVQRLLRAEGGERSTSGLKQVIHCRTYLGIAVGGLSGGGTYENPTAHEPLVSVDLWERANAVRGVFQGHDGSQVGAVRLHGLVFCAECGKRCRVAGNGTGTVSYSCKSVGCRRRASAVADRVDATVGQRLMRAMWPALTGSERVPEVDAVLSGNEKYRTALDGVRRAHAELDAYSEQVSVADVGRDVYLRAVRVRQEALALARADLADLPPMLEPLDFSDPALVSPTGPDGSDELTDEGLRQEARRFIARVVIRKGEWRMEPVENRVTVEWA